MGPSDEVIWYWNERLIPQILEIDDIEFKKLDVRSPHSLPCQGNNLFTKWVNEWRSIFEKICLLHDFAELVRTISIPLNPKDRHFIVEVYDYAAQLYSIEDGSRTGISPLAHKGQTYLMELFLLLHITLLYMREGFLQPLEEFLAKSYESNNQYLYLAWVNSLIGSRKLWGKSPCYKLKALRHAVAHGNWFFDIEAGIVKWFSRPNQYSLDYNNYELDVNSLMPLLRLYMRCGLFQMGMIAEYT